MSVSLSPVGGVAAQFFDSNGNPLSGGFIYTYVAGSSTPLATYTTSAGNIQHTNPVQLDAAGRIPNGEMWVISSDVYKFVIKTSNNVLVGTFDNIQGSDAASVPFNPPFPGSVTNNYSVQDRLSQYVSIKDFGAVGNGVTDDTAAFTTCLDYCRNNNLAMSVPSGEYVISSKVIRPESYDIHDAEAYKPINIIGQSPNSYFKYTGSGEDCFDFSRSRFVSLQNLGSNKRLYTIAGNDVGLGIYQQVENINVRDCQDASVFSFVNVITNPRAPSNTDPNPAQNTYTYPMVVYNNGLFNAFYVINECIDENGDVLVQGVNGDFAQQSAFAITDKVPATSAPIILIENTNPIDCRPVFQFQTSQSGVPVAGYAPIAYQVSGYGHIGIGCSVLNADTNAPGVATIKLRDLAPSLAFYDTNHSNKLAQLYSSNGAIGLFTQTTGGAAYNTALAWGNVFEPGVDNTITLGASGLRWSVVYAATGTINTSDAREKQQDRPLSEKEKAVAVKVKGLLKAFKFNEAVEQKGDKARIHFGVYAQEVAEAFASEGLNAEDYALFCYDEWEAQEEQKDSEGKVIVNATPSGNRYGVRYEELLAFVIAAL